MQSKKKVDVNIINYDGDTRVPMDDLIALKLLLSNFISTHNSKIMTVEIKKNYLATQLGKKHHMFLRVT